MAREQLDCKRDEIAERAAHEASAYRNQARRVELVCVGWNQPCMTSF